ncbi:putative membrane protein, partial [Phytophthora megakarya]
LTEFSDGGVASSVIMCGSLIILIALLGCCGAQWESKLFLFPYAILVLVSVIAQLSLAGFLTHVHSVLVEVARHNFDLSVLDPADQETLRWTNKRFKYVYYGCGFDVGIDLTGTRSQPLVASCSNPEFAWFASFVEENCPIGHKQLQAESTFLKCAGPTFSLSNAMTEHTMLCACETRMISWILVCAEGCGLWYRARGTISRMLTTCRGGPTTTKKKSAFLSFGTDDAFCHVPAT